MSRIIIVPIGGIEQELIEDLTETLRSQFNNDVAVEMPEPEPAYAYNPKRRQFSSTMILERLKSESGNNDIILGVSSVDLYVPDLNFVFGEAELSGRVAVISIARLRPEFYGLSNEDGILKERMHKEATHELGHILGLPHCPSKSCVMHFSNNIADTDRKSDLFCPECRQKIEVTSK